MKGKCHASVCVMLFGGLMTVSGCGGGGESGERIDLVQYLIPQSSVVITYNEFSVDDGDLYDDGTYDVTWQVFPGSAILNGGGDDVQISYDASRIYAESVYHEFSFPRNMVVGRVYNDSDGDKMAAFGPFESRTFSVGAGGPTYDAENVIVLVSRYEWDVDSDINVEYHVEGEGMIGSRFFEFCPANVQLNPDLDYESMCDPLSFSEIRIDD